MDRRRARDVFETEFEGHALLPVDRRRNLDVDLEVRTKGFAIVPGAAMASRSPRGPTATIARDSRTSSASSAGGNRIRGE
jgi:hypothetical protein